jgi:hypothetical protein
LSAGIDLPRFSILTPFPGTPLFERLEASGRITTRDWSLYDGQHVVFQPAKTSADALMAAHEKLWRDVYSFSGMRRRLFKRLSDRAGGLPLSIAANFGYRHYARNLSRFYTCTGGVA